MKALFTIWSASREKKALIVMDDDDENLYTSLILKACTKLELDGVKLVLESNGTPIEEDVLLFVKSEILILLQRDEIWMPPAGSSRGTSHSISASCSTITLPLSDISTKDNISSKDDISNKGTVVEIVKDCQIVYKVDCNAEYMWSSFEIPWQKLTRSELEYLQQGQTNKSTITNLIHLTVDEMRCIKNHIPTKAFKTIAKKIIDRYPNVFRDIDNDGVVLGDGTHSIVCKLQDRNNYLNRPHKRKSSSGDHNPVASKKLSVNARAGCPNWSPCTPKNDNIAQSERARTCTEIDEDYYDVLESSYPGLRSFLNSAEPPSISKLKEEWPIICSQKSIYWHFNKLTNSDIHLLNNLEEYLVKIQTVTHINPKEDDAPPSSQRALHCISSYFKENMDSFLISCSEEDRSDLDINNLPMTPVIVRVGDRLPVYYVYVEKEVISAEGYNNFMDALKVCFALYFILNIQYPKQFTVTLELLQRLILKIHPDAGSKCKKVNPTKKKVFNFINRFVKI